MSGNPTGSNVVPMPHAAAPAQASAPMPFPMWGGGGSLPWGPGCCPPGGMDALMKCYCDVQAATAFICSVMVQCIQTNPAVTAAIIAAIEASGSNLPLIGVTDGSNAQPGQVGEFYNNNVATPVTATGQSSQYANLGVLPAGDWDCFSAWNPGITLNNCFYQLNPIPSGASNGMTAQLNVGAATESLMVIGQMARISVAAPTLIVFQINVDAVSTGTGEFEFYARRAR